MLPLPLTVMRRVPASCVRSESRESEAFIRNDPTPPPNEAGAFAGMRETLILIAGVLTRLRTVRYSSWKKLSKMLPDEDLRSRTFTRHTSSAGSMVISPDCCGMSVQLRSTAAS